MNNNIALISETTLLNYNIRKDHLKLCYLWYDEVLIENIVIKESHNILCNKIGLDKREMSYLTDIILPLDKRVSKDLIENYKNYFFSLSGYPRWGKNEKCYCTYRRPQCAEEYAYNVVLNKIRKEWGEEDFYDNVELAEGHTRSVITGIKLWQMVNIERPCMLQTDKYEKIAMSAALSFNKLSSTSDDIFTLFELSVPSLSNVPWSKIIELRKRGHFSKLRDKLGSILHDSSGKLKNAQMELSRLEEEAINEILDEYKPNVKRVAIETLIGNIPIPYVNPASVCFNIRDIKKEVDKKEKYNWLFLLRDIRDIAKDYS